MRTIFKVTLSNNRNVLVDVFNYILITPGTQRKTTAMSLVFLVNIMDFLNKSEFVTIDHW